MFKTIKYIFGIKPKINNPVRWVREGGYQGSGLTPPAEGPKGGSGVVIHSIYNLPVEDTGKLTDAESESVFKGVRSGKQYYTIAYTLELREIIN